MADYYYRIESVDGNPVFEYFGYYYEIIDEAKKEVALINIYKAPERCVIPSKITKNNNDYTVTAIQAGVIHSVPMDKRKKDYRSLLSLTENCDHVKNETIKELVLPPTIKRIGWIRENFQLEKGGSWYTSISYLELKKLVSINIPNGCSCIGRRAFNGCSSLKDITLPDSLSSIGEGAFRECSSLKEITIPNGCSCIEARTFSKCSSLKEIVLPDSVSSIGEGAFYGCSSLNKITIPDSVISIGAAAFRSCTSLKEITIPSSVQTIDEGAFSDGDAGTSGFEVVNILNNEGEVVIHPAAFTNRVKINYLGKKKAPKPAAGKVAKEEKKDTTPAKGATIDLEKLIQAALVDGVVTDKEHAILIKKVKEAGGDVDEFELLLDARIYEATQKHAKAEPMAAPVKEKKETPKEASEAEKKPAEVKKEAKKEAPAACTKGATDEGRKAWENMEKDIKPALQILDKLVAGMPYVQNGTYQINYDSKSYIGFSQNGKSKNFATFAPQPKALIVNAWGMNDSDKIQNLGKALPNFEHKVTSRNVSYHTFKFSVDKAPTAEQTKAALTILEMARKNYEK